MPYHRSEEHTSELQSHDNLVCRLLLEKKTSTTSSPAPPRPPPASPHQLHALPPRRARCRARRGWREARPAWRTGRVLLFFLMRRPPPTSPPFPLAPPLRP